MPLLLIALLGQSPGAAPDVRAIETAISRPRMVHCDELACYYRPMRSLVVRAVACSPATAAGTIVCTYERAAEAPVVVLLPGDSPAPDERVWKHARTEFRATEGGGWIVLSDSDD